MKIDSKRGWVDDFAPFFVSLVVLLLLLGFTYVNKAAEERSKADSVSLHTGKLLLSRDTAELLGMETRNLACMVSESFRKYIEDKDTDAFRDLDSTIKDFMEHTKGIPFGQYRVIMKLYIGGKEVYAHKVPRMLPLNPDKNPDIVDGGYVKQPLPYIGRDSLGYIDVEIKVYRTLSSRGK